MEIPRTRSIIQMGILSVVLAAGSYQAPALGADSVTVVSTNPYYLLQETYENPRGQVMAGTTVGTCVVQSYARCPEASLKGRYLQGAFLSYARLENADFTRANLKAGSLAFAHVVGASFRGAELSATTMVGANAKRADFQRAQMVLMDNSHAVLRDADLRQAIIVDSAFTKADLRNVTLDQAIVRNVSLESADLRGVSFDQTDLSGSVLAGARIDDGALDRAILCNTVLPNGNLANPSSTGCEGAPSFGPHDATIVMTPANPLYTGAQAMQDSTPAVPFGTVVNGCRMQVKAKCPYVNLSAQNLSNVELSLSDLRGANFEGVGATSMNAPLSKATRLRGAGGNFQVAGFGFSDLTKADLTKAELSFAAFSFADLDGANMTAANLAFGDLSGASLVGANLSGVNLSDSNAIGADFTSANLRGANLSDADLTGADLTNVLTDGAIFCNTLMPDGSVARPTKGLCPLQTEP